MTSRKIDRDPSSFRDPSGYVFSSEGLIYRTVAHKVKDDYELFVRSGLFERLVSRDLIVKHTERDADTFGLEVYKVLQVQKIPVITYPQEWCFSQLRDAALITLQVLKESLSVGMILKDSSAFNIQFVGSKPVFIDTLSFTKYEEGKPWSGYRQFCEHFLAPLAIASNLGIEYMSMLRNAVDGIPLSVASKILPSRTWLNPATLFHIHVHAKSIGHYAENVSKRSSKSRPISKQNLAALISHLEGYIKKLSLPSWNKTQWQNYDQQTHYSATSKDGKAEIVKSFIEQVKPGTLWDVGGNDGTYSRLGANISSIVVSMDADALAIEKNYAFAKANALHNVYSLVMDLTNPTSGFGWAGEERKNLIGRSAPDMVLALAVIHHIAITYNIPFVLVSDYFAKITEWLLIEFVPADDEKIAPLPNTAGKENYSRENFDTAFLLNFDLIAEKKIEGSERSLLLLRRSKQP